MTRKNKRFGRNQDGTTTTHTGDDMPDDAFRSFAVWVNESVVSPYAKHHVPGDLRDAIDDVDDRETRRYLQAVVDAYEDAEVTPREFVGTIDATDGIDYFDPLSVPEGWGSNAEERPTPTRLDDLSVGDPCPSCLRGTLIKGVDGDPLEPARPWCDECLWIVGDDVKWSTDEPETVPKGPTPTTEGIAWPLIVAGVILLLATLDAIAFAYGALP